MITGSKSQFESRCRQRGYTLDEVMECVVSSEGDTWTVDETHPAYPRIHKQPPPSPPMPGSPIGGPGTELKTILKNWLGITATPGCSCNARAAEMDINESREPGWCESHIDEIVGWLREEAVKRGMPFLDAAGKILVRKAIKNAKKKAGHGRPSV